MTELLDRVIKQIKNLPPEDQDVCRKADHCVIASHLMEELKDQLTWGNCFAQTTEIQWETIANQVRQEIKQGDIFSLFSL